MPFETHAAKAESKNLSANVCGFQTNSEGLINGLNKQFDNIDKDKDQVISLKEVNDFAGRHDLSKEQSGVAAFLQENVYKIGALSGSKAFSKEDIKRLDYLDKLDPEHGPDTGAMVRKATIAGAVGGAAGTAIDSNAKGSDYANGGGKGAAVGATIGVIAATVAEVKFQNAVKDKAAVGEWGYFKDDCTQAQIDAKKAEENQKPARPGIQKEDLNEIADKYLPLMDVYGSGAGLEAASLEAAANAKIVPAELKPEFRFLAANADSIAHMSENTLARGYEFDGMVNSRDIHVLTSGLVQEKKAVSGKNAALGAVGCVVGGIGGAIVGNVPGAVAGCALGTGVATGGSYAYDTHGLDARNDRRQTLYTDLSKKMAQSW